MSYQDLVDKKYRIESDLAKLTFEEVNRFNNPQILCDLNCLDAKDALEFFNEGVHEVARKAQNQEDFILWQVHCGPTLFQFESDELQGLLVFQPKNKEGWSRNHAQMLLNRFKLDHHMEGSVIFIKFDSKSYEQITDLEKKEKEAEEARLNKIKENMPETNIEAGRLKQFVEIEIEDSD